MLHTQIRLLEAWWRLRHHLDHDDERGEVTASTALIVLLVIAAIAAGGIIATKITGNAEAVPTP
jgi:hypothetical protein